MKELPVKHFQLDFLKKRPYHNLNFGFYANVSS